MKALEFAGASSKTAAADQANARDSNAATLAAAFSAQRSEGTQLSSDLIKYGALALLGIVAVFAFKK